MENKGKLQGVKESPDSRALLGEPEEELEKKKGEGIMSKQQRVMLAIYGIVVCLVFVCSIGALDGTQVAGLKGQIRIFMSDGGGMKRMEQDERLLRDSTNNAHDNSMCLAGGVVNLVFNYIDMDDGVGIPDTVVSNMVGSLERGRRIGGSIRVGQKNVMAKHVSYHNIDGKKEEMESLLLECSSSECHLSMSGAFKVGWMVHDGLSLEYPENQDTLGLVRHLMVIDVSSIIGSRRATLGFPMVGVLSKDARIALAVVDVTRPETLTSVVHEVDAWLYGEELILGVQKNGQVIVDSCRLDAARLLRNTWKVVEQGRHVRVGPTAMESLEQAQQAYDSVFRNRNSQNVLEDSFRVWHMAYTALHNPDFGVEPRMPSMHVFALLMPFGLPIFFNFVQNAKFFIKKSKDMKEHRD